MTKNEIHDILADAPHERAVAERLAECAARIASGESPIDDREWLTATIADLRATLRDRQAMAPTVETIPELADPTRVHADTRRLMTGAIADLTKAAGRAGQSSRQAFMAN